MFYTSTRPKTNYMYHFKNPGNLKATISNLDAFLHRDLDTGFSTKWSGLWTPTYKLLDYYAYRVNGIWLNSENLEAVDYSDKITYYFETESLKITETISMPEQFPGMKSSLEIENKKDEIKAVQVGLEAGVDIRSKKQDIGPENYEIKYSNKIKVVGERELLIESDRELLTSGESYVNEHFPVEQQKCVIPRDISVRLELNPGETETVEFKFSSSKSSKQTIKQNDSRLEGRLDRCFNASVESMLNLIYDRKGLGIIAGHPWFQNYWARDTFWTVLGLIDAGYFEEAEEILENFAEKSLPGKINLDSENEHSARADTYPLFIIAADKLKRHYKISSTLENAMVKAFQQLKLMDGVVQHSPDGTWMDTLDRESAVDIQVLWLKASEIIGEKTSELEKGLERFKSEDYILDNLGENPAHTINPAVGLMHSYFSSKHLSKINAEFSSRYGARTRSMTDPGYEASGYHTGSCWGLTTCWAAAANFKHGKNVEGLNFLEKLAAQLDQGQPGALPEILDSESGENLGCVEQAWSAGMLVHVVDSYLLGIKVTEDKVEIDPCENYTGKRLQKRVGNNFIDFKVEDGEAEILNDPGLDRELII